MRLSGRAIGWLALGGLCALAAPLVPWLLWVAIVVDAALAIALIADALQVREAAKLRVARSYDDVLSLGTENLVTLTVENPTPLTFNLTLRDVPPDVCESTGEIVSGVLAAGVTFIARYHLTPRQRGEVPFGPLAVRVKTLLGLWVLQRLECTGELVKIYPNIRQTKQQHLLSRKARARQMGVRAMRLRGQGMEFDALREYLPDDELRRIDWHASARRGVLITREYDIERSQQIMLVLDLGRSMASHLDYMTKLDHAVNASVLLTYVAMQAGDRIGVMAFSDTVETYLPPGKGPGQLTQVLEHLYPLQPRMVEADYRLAFSTLAARQRKRSLIILFTDLVDPDSSRHLRRHLALLHPQHLVLCVALSDYELRDILDGPPPDLSSMYTQAMATAVLEDRQLALAELHQRGILTADATPSDLSVAVVNRYLGIKREGKV